MAELAIHLRGGCGFVEAAALVKKYKLVTLSNPILLRVLVPDGAEKELAEKLSQEEQVRLVGRVRENYAD